MINRTIAQTVTFGEYKDGNGSMFNSKPLVCHWIFQEKRSKLTPSKIAELN